jgi:hypothetical protein
VISTDASQATVRVIRTDEELMIARSVCRALGLGMAREKRNSDHATKYISRLDPFSADGPRWVIPDSEAAPRRRNMSVGTRADRGSQLLSLGGRKPPEAERKTTNKILSC